MVVAAGAVEHERVAEVIATHFVPPDGPALPLSGPPAGFVPGVRHETREDLHQLYLALGTRGLGYNDPERYALIVLNTLLGGGMSSRLFQSVREEAGLAYSVFSAADFYRETGMVSIQLGVAPDRGREALGRVRQELETLVRDGPPEEEVAAARFQLKGSVVMGQESVSSRMVHLAHEELYRGAYTLARRAARARPRRDPRPGRGAGAAAAAARPLRPERDRPGDRRAARRARLAGGDGLSSV